MQKQARTKEASEVMEIFEFAYRQSVADLQRLEELQAQYDNVVEESSWPTISQIPIPFMFSTVEKTLPDVMDYLFPTSNFIKLYPLDTNADIDAVRKTELALYHTLMNRMNLQQTTFATIKDCFKLGLGYGVVEPYRLSQPTLRINAVMKGTEEVRRARILVPTDTKISTRYRYIAPGRIIVYPDGSAFNGDKAVSWSFFLDTYKESDFRRMYDDQPTEGELAVLKGSPDAIINEAKAYGFFCNVPIVDLVAALGGIDIRKITQKYGKEGQYMPVRIPVLKCYSADRHVWIANGTRVIYDQKDKFQTMRCPLVKCTAWPDGERWYPMSMPEAAQKMSIGMNLWMNALYDLMTYRLKPTVLYNKRVIDRPPDRGPQSDIGVEGSVDGAFTFAAPPQMDQGLFEIGNNMQTVYGDVTGQSSSISQAKPGLMRGGAYAFESLLQSTTGRTRLAGAILETGFIQDVVAQTLVNMQLTIPEDGDTFTIRQYDSRSGQEYIETLNVTPDDIINAFDVKVSLKGKHKNTSIDNQQRLAEWNAFKDSEYIDQYEFLVSRFTDEEEARKFVLPREKVRKMQEQNRQAGLAERQVGIQAKQAQATQAQAQAAQTEQEMAAPAEGGGLGDLTAMLGGGA